MDYQIGQRFISEAEADLGLGMVQDIDARVVSVYFPAGDSLRLYAKQNAPLTRVVFKLDDKLPLQDGTQLVVCAIKEEGGIYFYQGTDAKWWAETQLSADIQLNQPLERLFSAQIDNNHLFELRKHSVAQKSSHRQRSFYGLLGARTSLLPHQVYISEQVTRDSMPRVLLADEVGLGKTIEAGLILHRLMLLERVQRALIIVPDALVHQWLVEMIRRFNLRFSVLSCETVSVIEQTLEQAQSFICPLSLAIEEKVSHALIAQNWDILIVDEAHHLTWTPTFKDAGYQLVETLSIQTQGVLLLTATPEQLGIEGHFARLRLLDPERYQDFEKFLAEQNDYTQVADIAAKLANNEQLDAAQSAQLQQWVHADADPEQQLHDLIDRFGPGRALYRNTRHNVAGFKARLLKPVALSEPEEYKQSDAELKRQLYPERYVANWLDVEPKIDWLLEIISQLKERKAILICHQAEQVLALEKYLWDNFVIATAVFHEGMDLIERDKAAAFFADEKQGAKILLCSEIGSEGRNFQFASHLILFDLPFNCDLIEQRIGRLDRIGQNDDIQIHVPYFADSASQRWLDILHQGLNVFSAPSPAAQSILLQHQSAIEAAITDKNQDINALIAKLAKQREQLQAKLNQGRDRLLELHSCHPVAAYQLAESMQSVQQQDETSLIEYMDLFANAFGVEVKDLGNQCISVQPGNHMLIPDLPYLPEDGFMASAIRQQALSRDDVQFLSWEHPFIQQALDIMTTSAFGNSAVGYVEQQPFATGSVFVELSFVAYCSAPSALQIERFLPPQALHIVMTPDAQLRINQPLDLEVKGLHKKTALGLLHQQLEQLKPTLEKLHKMGANQLHKLVELSLKKAQTAYQQRVVRLQELGKKNAKLSPELIAQVQQEGELVQEKIANAQLKLDAVRLIFCS